MLFNEYKGSLKGNIKVPGDKSISHRSIMMGALGKGKTQVSGFLLGEDCLSTIECFKDMGVDIKITEKIVEINGVGLKGLKDPDKTLDAGNSGTTIRLISGILAGQNFKTKITGDNSLKNRPMDRIAEPLSEMGAKIECSNGKYPPMTIYPTKKIKGINYIQKKASAQVKSAILLAGLYSDDEVRVIQPEKSRDHTEKMFKFFGINIDSEGKEVILKKGAKNFNGKEIFVPGDISSAAFYIVAASIFENSHIIIKDVGLNETRTGIIDVMLKMGAEINILNKKTINEEEVGDVEVVYNKLKGIEISGEIIPRIIDEIPIIALAAVYAEGNTVIKNAEELKVKESNRIEAVCEELSKLGAKIQEKKDGMIIKGTKKLTGSRVKSRGDHRIAMMLAVAGEKAEGKTEVDDFECANISNPEFIQIFNNLK